MDDNVIDLSTLKKSAAMGDDVPLTDAEARDVQLLTMIRNLELRMDAMSAEQTAMDENMAHISQALFSVVEAAAAKLKIHE